MNALAADLRKLSVSRSGDANFGATVQRLARAALDSLGREVGGVGQTLPRQNDLLLLLADLVSRAVADRDAEPTQERVEARRAELVNALDAAGIRHDLPLIDVQSLIGGCATDLYALSAQYPIAERNWLAEITAQLLNAFITAQPGPDRDLGLAVIEYFLDSVPGREILIELTPDWLASDTLDVLRQEAQRSFECQNSRYVLAEYSTPTPKLVRQIDEFERFHDWVRQTVPLNLGAEVRKVLFQYNQPTDHLPWHVDKPAYVALNCLICLERSEVQQSVLQLLPKCGGVREVNLQVGDVLLFKGDAIPHRRTPLAPGEHVRLLSIGFHIE